MFNNLIEVTQYFSDKQRCIDYLSNMRWNGNVTCPMCNHDKVYKLNGADKRWKCASCRKPFSVTKGTIFENSPIPLQKWFVALYLMSNHKKGISSIQLSKDISVMQRTAWFMLHRLRHALETKSFSVPIMATTIECDETYIGGKMKNKHKSKRVEGAQGRSTKDKTPVFGLIERNGRVVAMKVSATTKKEIQPIINQYVAKGANVMTDEWMAYKGLDKRFNHAVVKHGEGIYVVGDCHTNTIEGFWSLLKRSIVGTWHNLSVQHLDSYINEVEWRYNNRDLKGCGLFNSMLSLTNSKRLTYKSLTSTPALS